MADKVPNVPQPQPSRAQQTPAPDSPYYDLSNMPDGCTPSARWLFKAGWKCIGEPNWEMTQWFPPGSASEETFYREPKMGWVQRVLGKSDAMGHPLSEPNYEQLKQQDGTALGVLNVPIAQLVVVPPAAPMMFREAVKAQQIRDEKARQDAQKAARKSA